MVEKKRLICGSDELPERGKGLRFTIDTPQGEMPAFVVRYRGRVHGYLNRCAHVWIELDWQPGEFFDVSGLYLVCATHGATYVPDSGHCVAGPCKGQNLKKLPVEEFDGRVYLVASEDTIHG
jgi:nitrite reductase/ring-hydroxylating ferredoxin subunit